MADRDESREDAQIIPLNSEERAGAADGVRPARRARPRPAVRTPAARPTRPGGSAAAAPPADAVPAASEAGTRGAAGSLDPAAADAGEPAPRRPADPGVRPLNGARPSRAKRPTSRPGPAAADADPADADSAAADPAAGRDGTGRPAAGRTAVDRTSSAPGATARPGERSGLDGGAGSGTEHGAAGSVPAAPGRGRRAGRVAATGRMGIAGAGHDTKTAGFEGAGSETAGFETAGSEGAGSEGAGSEGAGSAEAGDLETALAGVLAFLRRRITGDYVIDEHGFDPDLTEHVIAPLLRPVYRDYFRIETRGLENVPDVGGALVVANHSGTLPMDALMMAMAILDHHPAHRNLRMLAADLVFAVPFLAPLARKIGNTLACQADAERLLTAGHLVGVWPEGFKGVGKPFSERYTLQRFGRGGFVSAALRTGVPIIPCTVVGAEEIYPMIGNVKSLARLLGLPYLPITPTFPWLGLLGLIPLPSKWIIEFGEPVPTDSYPAEAADDPMLVFELTDRIRETIQHTLYSLLMQRRSVFF
ncbi:1-acyl-sn-glycerol-3-phosphate acyltransferase [Frankia torreyi]|uniref:1-acyl-sn-glycerol-3-phosphate acyltransferase n=1 Tax=Frankia torreyi TaxID=1856 RepID=A0A0D8BGP1_9ACTN|nr:MULTISPECIES: lysophospholipid acyltransferase family protein [Frankia]KJE23210.1 1-acyl-sn-glycerol-3-phosphate acyltransferase [Frankia torreyi]KQM06513.1 1-acyl-sn-glycerol-3-phosphate acyltransferase [Frankia sp. CpI1-P]